MKAPHRRAGALLLLAPAATLHAAEPAIDATAGHRLAPVVITSVAPSSPLTLETDPGEPRQPVPASDAADYLKTIPGFSAVRSGGTNGDPVLRGQFGSRLNLLVDGGEMIGACPNRMDAPSSYIAPETYDRLTVIKGPQSVQWGPPAPPARCCSNGSRCISTPPTGNSTPPSWPVPTVAGTRCWTRPWGTARLSAFQRQPRRGGRLP